MMTACLSSCGIFGGTASRDFLHPSALPPASAAWLVADVCRQWIPGADPQPEHAWAPLVHNGEQRFLIRYCRYPGDGFRAFLNGRITPPTPTGPVEGRAACPLRGCRFVPAPRYTGTPASAADQIWIQVRPEGTGCSIRIALRGSCAMGNLTHHLEKALHAADAIETSARLLNAGEFAQADRVAEVALRQWREGTLDGHHELVARLYYHRAVAAAGRDSLSAVRGHLSKALCHDPDLVPARYSMVHVCERLGDLAALRNHLHLLRLVEPKSERVLRRGAELLAAHPGQTQLQRRAATLLFEGDLTAAAHWARQALARTPDSIEAHGILAEVYSRRGEHQRALEEELVLLEQTGFTAPLVLRIARRQEQVGNALAGLRLLTRFQEQLANSAPEATRSALRALAAKLPAATASRILHTGTATDSLDVSELAMDATGPACAALLARLQRLRSRHDRLVRGDDEAERPRPLAGDEDGYRSAPGVSPAPIQ